MATATSDGTSLISSATSLLTSAASLASSTASPTTSDSSSLGLNYTSSTRVAPTACRDLFDQHQVYVIPKGDPDISGIGVIVAFLASAGFVLVAALISYRLGLIHKDLLNIADRRAFHARSTGSEQWRGAVDKFILVFSDQQIITGIALLIAGFAQWNTINVYHWQMVLYLAWMSSNTHLTSLTVLKFYLQERYTLKTWRITGMGILLILLAVAFIPTASESWLFAVSTDYYVNYNTPEGDYHSAGNPARCYWRNDMRKGINIDAPFSYCIMLCSYVWKAGALYDTKGRWRRWYRHAPLNFLGKRFLRIAQKIAPEDFGKIYKPRVFWYRLVLVQYCGWICIIDFLESFLASLWALYIYFLWGAIVLFSTRTAVPQVVRDEENSWRFGQVLPLMLLMLPVVAVAEHFARDKESNDSQEIKELIEPVRARKDIDFSEMAAPTDLDDEYNQILVPAGLSLSGYLHTIRLAKYPEQETLSREFFYKSKFFKSCLVWINIFLFVGSSAVFALQGSYAFEHIDFLKGWLWLPIACLAVAAWIWWGIWMTLGMFMSKIFR